MEEGHEGDIVNKEFTDECTTVLSAVADALYAIGGKWKLMIIISIARGNNRFSEIQKKLTGISARVLSNELKELELNSFILRKVTPGYPVSIEYELTPYSNTLQDVVSSLKEWGILHRQKIKDDRPAGNSKTIK